MDKDRILEILESAKDKNDDVPMNLVRKAFDKLPFEEPKPPSNGSITCMKSENTHVRTTDDCISRQDAIDALKICDNNEDGINCHKCPLRDERWDGAWQDDETNCYTKLMRDSAKLLALPSAQPDLQPTCNELATDCISRQAAIDALDVLCQEHRYKIPGKRETYSPYNEAWQDALDRAEGAIGNLPTAQPDRDIPLKPIETTDKAWGIPLRQAVCPKCDYYLGHIAFLDDYKGKRITYCEVCGQAIDWEGWEWDE